MATSFAETAETGEVAEVEAFSASLLLAAISEPYLSSPFCCRTLRAGSPHGKRAEERPHLHTMISKCTTERAALPTGLFRKALSFSVS